MCTESVDRSCETFTKVLVLIVHGRSSAGASSTFRTKASNDCFFNMNKHQRIKVIIAEYGGWVHVGALTALYGTPTAWNETSGLVSNARRLRDDMYSSR